MALIISENIWKKECKKYTPSQAESNKQHIIKGFYKGIFTHIKGSALPKDAQLFKVYSTTIQGARRIVYLFDTTTEDGFFLFYRSKNDPIGKNISIKNPLFRSALHQYLDLLSEDILTQKFRIYEEPVEQEK